MRKISRNFTGLTTAVALMVAGCSGDIVGVDSGDVLTSTEVAAVVAALVAALETAGAGPVAAPGAGPALVPIDVGTNFNVTAPCESGDINVSGSLDGTVDDETFAMDVTMDVSWNPNGCVVGDGLNTFTLNGAPEIALHLDWTSSQETVSLSGTETGGFSYTSSDGRTGSCALNVTYSIVTTATSVDATVTGSVCGLSADGFETLGG